jgi:hypothetical protein
MVVLTNVSSARRAILSAFVTLPKKMMIAVTGFQLVNGQTLVRRFKVAALVVLALNVSGCRGTYDATVKGTVSFDGKQLSRGTVSYYSTSTGSVAYARINEDGSYVVKTGRESGLPAGDYQVTVASNEPPDKPSGANGGPPPPGKSITPDWYRSKQTSGLKFTVKPGSNVINLELTSAPPSGYKPPKKT